MVSRRLPLQSPRKRQCFTLGCDITPWGRQNSMTGNVHKLTLAGNLGRDPEIRSTQDGTRIANLSLAASESWRDKNSGERKERTEWHRVVIFSEGLVRVAEQYLKKGAKASTEGQTQTRE